MTSPSLLNLADEILNTEDPFFSSEVHRLSRVVARARLEGRIATGCAERLGASPPSAPTASPVLRTEPASGLVPDGRVPAGAGVMPLARQLGEYFDARPVEQPQPAAMPRRPNPEAWPPEAAAEMDAIWRDEA
jgi:hypothetical protein